MNGLFSCLLLSLFARAEPRYFPNALFGIKHHEMGETEETQKTETDTMTMTESHTETEKKTGTTTAGSSAGSTSSASKGGMDFERMSRQYASWLQKSGLGGRGGNGGSSRTMNMMRMLSGSRGSNVDRQQLMDLLSQMNMRTGTQMTPGGEGNPLLNEILREVLKGNIASDVPKKIGDYDLTPFDFTVENGRARLQGLGGQGLGGLAGLSGLGGLGSLGNLGSLGGSGGDQRLNDMLRNLLSQGNGNGMGSMGGLTLNGMNGLGNLGGLGSSSRLEVMDTLGGLDGLSGLGELDNLGGVGGLQNLIGTTGSTRDQRFILNLGDVTQPIAPTGNAGAAWTLQQLGQRQGSSLGMTGLDMGQILQVGEPTIVAVENAGTQAQGPIGGIGSDPIGMSWVYAPPTHAWGPWWRGHGSLGPRPLPPPRNGPGFMPFMPSANWGSLGLPGSAGFVPPAPALPPPSISPLSTFPPPSAAPFVSSPSFIPPSFASPTPSAFSYEPEFFGPYPGVNMPMSFGSSTPFNGNGFTVTPLTLNVESGLDPIGVAGGVGGLGMVGYETDVGGGGGPAGSEFVAGFMEGIGGNVGGMGQVPAPAPAQDGFMFVPNGGFLNGGGQAGRLSSLGGQIELLPGPTDERFMSWSSGDVVPGGDGGGFTSFSQTFPAEQNSWSWSTGNIQPETESGSYSWSSFGQPMNRKTVKT